MTPPAGDLHGAATLPRLLLITDRSQLPLGRPLVETIAECVEAGASHVVLRELDLPPGARTTLAGALGRAGATVIAARKPLPGAAGLHLPAVAPATPQLDGATDEPPGSREAPIIGRSCHSLDEVTAAAASGATYATLGPFAPTPSKPGYGPPLSRREYADLPLPTYALGGIRPGNTAQAIRAGAHGIAVMGVVMRAGAPGAVVHELLEAIG